MNHEGSSMTNPPANAKVVRSRNQAYIATAMGSQNPVSDLEGDYFLLDVVVYRAWLMGSEGSPEKGGGGGGFNRSYVVSAGLEGMTYTSRASPKNGELQWNEAATFVGRRFFQSMQVALAMKRSRGQLVVGTAALPMQLFLDEHHQKRTLKLRDSQQRHTASLELVFQLSFTGRRPSFYADLGYPVRSVPLRLRTGDLVFVSTRRVQSLATKVLSRSAWDHVALVVQVDEGLMLLEALYPQGVCLNSLSTRISSELRSGSTIGVRKLRYDVARYRTGIIPPLRRFLSHVLGAPYELNLRELVRGVLFGAAGASTPNDSAAESFFCSELIAAAYQAIGFLPASFNSSRCLPATFATKKIKLQRFADLSHMRVFSSESLEVGDLSLSGSLSSSSPSSSSSSLSASSNSISLSSSSSSTPLPSVASPRTTSPAAVLEQQSSSSERSRAYRLSQSIVESTGDRFSLTQLAVAHEAGTATSRPFIRFLARLAQRLALVEVRTLDPSSYRISNCLRPSSALSEEEFNGLIESYCPSSREATELRSLVSTSGARGFLDSDEGLATTSKDCLCDADPCLCHQLQTSDAGLLGSSMKTQGMFASIASKGPSLTPRSRANSDLEDISSLSASANKPPGDPKPLLDMVRSAGAQGFLSFDEPRSKLLSSGSASSSSSLSSSSTTPRTLSSPPLSFPEMDSEPLRNVLHSSGARGFIELSLSEEVNSCAPGEEGAPNRQRALLISERREAQALQTTPQELRVLRTILHDGGARGFLELSDMHELAEGRDSPDPEHPLLLRGAPVGFLGLIDNHNNGKNPLESNSGEKWSPRDGPSSPKGLSDEEPPSDPLAFFVEYDRLENDLNLDYSTESSGSEEEREWPFPFEADLSEYQSYHNSMNFPQFLDLVSGMSGELLRLEKTLPIARSLDDSLLTLPGHHPDPVGIFAHDPLGSSPMAQLRALKSADALFMLQLLCSAEFSKPGDSLSDPAFQHILMFLACHRSFLTSIQLFTWLHTNLNLASHIMGVWMSHGAFVPDMLIPEVAKLMSTSRFHLLASDMGSHLYAHQQNCEWVASLPALCPFPSLPCQPYPVSVSRLRSLLKTDPHTVAIHLAAWSYMLYTTETPVAAWFNVDLLESRSLGPLAKVYEFRTKLRLWCFMSLLGLSDSSERAETLGWFIMLTNDLLRLRAFASAGCLCETLKHAAITRLTATFALLPSDISTLYRHKIMNWNLYQEQALTLASQNICYIPEPEPLYSVLRSCISKGHPGHPDDPSLANIKTFVQIQDLLLHYVWPLWNTSSRLFYLSANKLDPAIATLLFKCVLAEHPRKKTTPDALLKLSQRREKTVLASQDAPDPGNCDLLRVVIEPPKALLLQGASSVTAVQVRIMPSLTVEDLRVRVLAEVERHLPRTLPINLYEHHHLFISDAHARLLLLPSTQTVHQFFYSSSKPTITFAHYRTF